MVGETVTLEGHLIDSDILRKAFARIVEGGDKGRPIVLDAPDAEASRVFNELAGVLARKLAVLAETTPKIADANITWVS